MADQYGNFNGGNPAPTPMNPQTSAGNQVLTGPWANPNGNITPPIPAQAAIYTQDQANPVNEWAWSVSNANWFSLIS